MGARDITRFVRLESGAQGIRNLVGRDGRKYDGKENEEKQRAAHDWNSPYGFMALSD
jgi:hypothetical protein